MPNPNFMLPVLILQRQQLIPPAVEHNILHKSTRGKFSDQSQLLIGNID